MRRSSVVVVALLLFALLPMSAGAITNGEEDTLDEYPFVGMLAFYDDIGEYMWRCTGTLVSDTVVVTASHCTDGTSSARAYFDVDVTAPYWDNVGGLSGTPYTHPDYNPRTINNDVAVVVLDGVGADRSPYPVLADEGVLSEMKRDHEIQDEVFIAVGYGGVPGFPPPNIAFDLMRRFASSPYGGLTRNNLHLLQNPNANATNGGGGTCFGDSGGPHLWGNVLVSVTSWGDAICRSNDMTQRLDIEPTLDFVSGFLPTT